MTYAQIIEAALQQLNLDENDVQFISIDQPTNTVTVLSSDMAKHKLPIPTETEPPRLKTIKKTSKREA